MDNGTNGAASAPANSFSKVEAFLTPVLARSAVDADFRKALLEDPRQAIYEATGQEMPADRNIVFIENQADATIVLPTPLSTDDLSLEELEAVAGGSWLTEKIGYGIGWVAGQVVNGAEAVWDWATN